MTATMREGWAMLRGSWWDLRVTLARQKKAISVLMPFTRQVRSELPQPSGIDNERSIQAISVEWILSTITSMICSYDPTPVTPDTGWFAQSQLSVNTNIAAFLSINKTALLQYLSRNGNGWQHHTVTRTKYYLLLHHFNYRFWFNFSVENVHVDQRIIFNIVNLSKTRNLFTIGATPIVRSSSRPKWWDNIIDWQCRDIAPWPGRGYRPPTSTTTSPRPTPTTTSCHSLSPSTLMMNDTSLHSVGENISMFIIHHLD